jgi:hypothetical protein
VITTIGFPVCDASFEIIASVIDFFANVSGVEIHPRLEGRMPLRSSQATAGTAGTPGCHVAECFFGTLLLQGLVAVK